MQNYVFKFYVNLNFQFTFQKIFLNIKHLEGIAGVAGGGQLEFVAVTPCLLRLFQTLHHLMFFFLSCKIAACDVS